MSNSAPIQETEGSFEGIQRENIYENSRGLSILYGVIGRDYPFFGVILYSLIWVALFSIATLIEGTFFMDGTDNIGWGEDYVWMAVVFVVTVMFYTMKIMFDKFLSLFSDRILSVINWKEITRQEYSDIVNEQIDFIEHKTKSSKIWLGLLWLLGIGGIGFYGIYMQVVSLPEVDIWHLGHYPLGYAMWFLYTAILLAYLGPMLIWRFIAIMTATKNIVKEVAKKNGFIITPLSPDRAGGLSPLGDFGLNVAYVSTTPLISLVVWFFVREINILILVTIPVLIVFIIISFFLSLWSTHDLMKSAKERELNRISSEFDKYYQLVVKNIDQDGATFNNETENAVTAMEKLRTLYEDCEKMVVWPFNMEILSKLTGAIVIPLIPIAVELIF